VDALFDFCLQFTLWLQSAGDWIYNPMSLISSLGTENFYLFVAPAIFWCLDVRLGLRLGLSLMVCASLNSLLKLIFHSPRPFWYATSVNAPHPETSFGIPSGHSQNAVVVWGILANWFKHTYAWIAALLLVFLIGFSRLALGVHFLVDVLIGWLVGALLLWGILANENKILAWFAKFHKGQQVLLVFLASIFIIVIGIMIRLFLSDWEIPTQWLENAYLAFPTGTEINPLTLSGLVSNAGAFFGLAVGGIWLFARGSFNAAGPLLQRLLRFLIGLIGIYLIWGVLGSLLPRGESILPLALRYFRYSLVGLWISALAPFLFVRIGIAQLSINKQSD